MQGASQEQHGVFSPAVRNYALGVLVVVYTFNFIDRQILSILLEPIKQDLGLSDSALGMLTGFAFALFYATLGIPIARFADRSNRRNLIAWALAIWSAMTAVSGLAQNFWHLLWLGLALVLARPVARLLPTQCSRTISRQRTEPLPLAFTRWVFPSVSCLDLSQGAG